MHRLIYSLIFYLAMPLVLLRLIVRSLKAPAYRRRIAERFAWQSPPTTFNRDGMTLWVHAVSVGETVACAPLVAELQRCYPTAQIVVTTMTPTGSDRVRSLFGDSVTHCYIPYDLPGACRRFLNKYRPQLLILMETELWPNLIDACHLREIPLLLANARLSQKSAAGYGRFPNFTRGLLTKIDIIAAQATSDAERFVALGAPDARVSITGSLKFIAQVEVKERGKYFSTLANSTRPTLVAASTRDGEEQKVLDAFEQCLCVEPNLLLILIPRHPERFVSVYKLSEGRGLRTLRRSEEAEVKPDTQVLIGDSMGEMIDYYRSASIAFVGGSLVDTGCQNVLEPAALGIPIVVGPSQFNFATICSQLEQNGALKTVQDEDELARAVLELLVDTDARKRMGERRKALIAENQNALPALMKLIVPLIQTVE